MQNEPMATDEHKAKRLKFTNWVRTNFRQEDRYENSVFRRKIV